MANAIIYYLIPRIIAWFSSSTIFKIMSCFPSILQQWKKSFVLLWILLLICGFWYIWCVSIHCSWHCHWCSRDHILASESLFHLAPEFLDMTQEVSYILCKPLAHFLPRSRISRLSEEPWLLLVGNGIWRSHSECQEFTYYLKF